ncbi:MAG: hypothetical protein PHT94_00580 [Candidatus Nanoarchaeia archaeon]|nr:hypothetical protein [Candidatus Nanoarchaeia archaeon]
MIYSIGDNKRIVGFQNNLEGTISYNSFHDKVLKEEEFKELVNKIKTISDKFKEIRNNVISDMKNDSNILKIVID